MPRKNQRRKNANSQSGRRKAKPIKFNPSDIKNEERQLCASFGVDDAVNNDNQDQIHDQEMESIDGSVPIREDDDEHDENSGDDQIIVDTTLDDNEIDRTNQMDKTDDEKNDAATPIPVACTDSLANHTTVDDKSMAMSQAESHELGTSSPTNSDINSGKRIAMSFDVESNSNAENKADSDDRSLIITTTIPESTNAYAVYNDINRNSSNSSGGDGDNNSNSSDSGKSGNSTDASCDIIVSVPTDAPHFSERCAAADVTATAADTVAPANNSFLTLDNLTDAKIQITEQSNVADADHSLELPTDNATDVDTTQKSNDVTTAEIMNYAQINLSNAKPEDQTASIHVPLDENHSNNSANGIEIENTQCTQKQQQPHHSENSDNFKKEAKSNCVDNSNGENQEQPQINQTKVANEDVNSTSAIAAHSIETNRTESKSETNPSVHEVKSKQSYRVESPEPKPSTALNLPVSTAIKKSRSLGDCTDEFGIQELSDACSSAENDNTPLVSEVESEPDVPETNKVVKLQYPNRLISVETFPLDYQDDSSVLCPKLEEELRNCIAQQLPQQESQPAQQSPPMSKRQKRPPLPPPPPLSNAQFLHPINNYLHAISEENSDASDIEHKPDEVTAEKVNSPKANKADAMYPRSHFDFSRVSRHTNLIAPSTEAIREEASCVLVDTKLIGPGKVNETNQPWTTSTVDEQSHAELVYLDSSSSNTSLSDIESISGVEGDVEDLNSESDVRIETPTIGGNSFSAFKPIVKKTSADLLAGLKQILNDRSECIETNSFTDNETSPVLSNKKSFLNVEINKVPNPSPIDHSHFKPINENVSSIRSLLENIAAASIESLVDNEIVEIPLAYDDRLITNDRIQNENSSNSIHTNSTNGVHNDTLQTQTQTQTQPEHDQQIDTKHNQLLSPKFKIGEICSNQMLLTGSVNSNNQNVDSSAHNNKELNRQDSASSHGSSHTTSSTSHSSQCTAKYLASQTSPNEFGDFSENTFIKSLRQLSIERLESLPYGDLILDEVAKHSQQLTDPNMPYPPPRLPRIEDLEILSESVQQPRPPPRNYQSKIKFYSNFKLKSSPSPPPVPQRPWLGVPTAENPNVLVCLSPAQREFYQENNSAPDHLLDLHNKFVDRRGYHEYTDDEVMAINFRDSVASSKQAAQCEISNMKSKDDNRLLALIREINQLTNTSVAAEHGNDNNDNGNDGANRSKGKETTSPTTNRSSQSPAAQQQSDHATLKMSRSNTTDPNYGFNNKRFSNYFDELSRLHPIVEETPKIYTNIETTNYQSRKRIENGQIVYDYSNSSHEKSSSNTEPPNRVSATANETNNCQTTAPAAANFNNSPFDVNIDNKAFVGEALSANQIAENRYCKYAECKNSRTDDSVHHHHSNLTTSEKQQPDESLKKITTEPQESCNPNSRSSFKEFDFVPKIFSNFFRTNKTEGEQCGSAVITKESSETTTVQTNTENINVTNRCEIIGSGGGSSTRNSVSPLPLRKSEWYSSTQSLYDLFGEEIDPMPGSPSASVLGVRGVTHRGRISPNPIRAPRINDSPNTNTTSTTSDYSQHHHHQHQHQHHQHQYQQQHRHYDWQATKHNRNFENRQSMIDQTPITRFVTHNPRRMSLPKAMTDSQLAYILEKERHITSEFDKLEKDRQRLLQELEEMQVNQSFEDFYKQHKKRNSLLPTLGPLSEEERMKKRMQEEWLSKVAEREERRLQKVIKVTHGTSEISPPYKSLTNRGLSDEFLERVKERRTKLHIPSDSDWDSGAESQPIKREPVSPNIDPTVKVIDDGHEADIKQLPKHLREFAEFTTKCEASESKSQCDTNATSTIKTESKEIIHTIERCDNQDGIWSPSGTPQPIRRAFPNEGGQFKSEPSLVHSTPSTPVAERRDIRSVKFESPITPRKNLSQQTHSGSTPSLTQPTIIVQPPPTSPKYKEHSTSEHGADHSKIRSYYPAGVRQINDASYSHNEYVTQRQNLENERQRKMASDGRTGEPVEVTSRSEANDNQHEWYKKMYNTIHKVSDGDGYVTVRYKTRRAGQYPYKTSTNGYASEPERNYNSDYSIKYKTLDRRRNPSSENVYRTLPNPMKSTNVSYKNQPGKIENFTPGHSSATDKERREEQIKTRNEINKVCEGNLSRALKDQGYESDSTLVFRKKDSSQIAPLSPVEQKQAYLNLQAGGEAPLQGFRKPAPEKPRECENTVPPPPPPPAKGAYYYNTEQPDLESARRYVESDVNIHYKTPVRYEIKDPISDAELIHRQEQAKKLYQEERRRKYLQELQDLNNRRHTDNFTPSQKSPISLHRYDDFGTIYDYVTKSSNYPKTVARALYNFQGQTSRELSFKKGDIIHIRREIDNNWYEGEINATIGLLPANYVEIISKDGVRLPTKKPTEGQARAKFNFQAQSAIELSLHKGELVVLTRRVDDNWFEGRVANQKGIFPVSYVEVLTDIGSDALPVVPSKPVGAPASHSLITSPNYQLSPRSNYSTDFTTTTNIISNGNHSPVVRETSKTLQKTEVLHVDTTNSEPVPYRAIYKYRPQNSDELELQEGDTVYVLEKCDDGWFVGTSQRTGFFGTFPGNYVEKLLL